MIVVGKGFAALDFHLIIHSWVVIYLRNSRYLRIHIVSVVLQLEQWLAGRLVLHLLQIAFWDTTCFIVMVFYSYVGILRTLNHISKINSFRMIDIYIITRVVNPSHISGKIVLIIDGCWRITGRTFCDVVYLRTLNAALLLNYLIICIHLDVVLTVITGLELLFLMSCLSHLSRSSRMTAVFQISLKVVKTGVPFFQGRTVCLILISYVWGYSFIAFMFALPQARILEIVCAFIRVPIDELFYHFSLTMRPPFVKSGSCCFVHFINLSN